MKLTRVRLSFVALLGAGALLLGATFLLPSPKTYGSQMGQPPATSAKTTDSSGGAQMQSPATSLEDPSAQAPARPQAPIEKPIESTTTGDAGTAPSTANNGAGSLQLPAAGDGSIFNSTTENVVSYLFMGLGAAMLATGFLVWMYSRRSRQRPTILSGSDIPGER